MTDRTILITGAAGLFGDILRTYWGARYRLRLADVRPIENLALHEEYVKADIVDWIEKYCDFLDAKALNDEMGGTAARILGL